MLSVRPKHAEYASLVAVRRSPLSAEATMAKRRRRRLERRWIRSGRESDKATFVGDAVTLTDSSMSPDGS